MSTNFVASWRPDAAKFYNKANAQKVAEEICSLGEKAETSEILDMARDESKEIHKLIDWNDTTAAEKYRLEQVRHIIHDLRIVKIGLNGEKPKKINQPLRICYSLQGETGFRPTTFIFENADLHQQLLMTAKSELNAFAIKYAALQELKPVFEAIKNLDIA